MDNRTVATEGSSRSVVVDGQVEGRGRVSRATYTLSVAQSSPRFPWLIAVLVGLDFLAIIFIAISLMLGAG